MAPRGCTAALLLLLQFCPMAIAPALLSPPAPEPAPRAAPRGAPPGARADWTEHPPVLIKRKAHSLAYRQLLHGADDATLESVAAMAERDAQAAARGELPFEGDAGNRYARQMLRLPDAERGRLELQLVRARARRLVDTAHGGDDSRLFDELNRLGGDEHLEHDELLSLLGRDHTRPRPNHAAGAMASVLDDLARGLRRNIDSNGDGRVQRPELVKMMNGEL